MHIDLFDALVRIALTVATTFLFAIVFAAYMRLRSQKLLLISVGFGIFFVHALVTIPELVDHAYHVALDENAHLLIHFVALTFILVGILKD